MKPLSRFLVSIVAGALAVLTFVPAGRVEAEEGRWELISPPGASVTALAAAPGNRRVLYAGTATGRVYRSADAGTSWVEVTGGDFPPVAVRAVDVDPRDASTAYVSVCTGATSRSSSQTAPLSEILGGLYRTRDAGQTWTLLEDLGLCGVYDLAFDPFQPSRILAGAGHGLYQSEDGGASWRLAPGQPVIGAARALLFDPSTPGTVFALHGHSGLLKSLDGGATWRPRNRGLPADRHQLDGLVIAAPAAGGPKTLYIRTLQPSAPVFRSTDGGERWTAAASGLEGRQVHDLAVSRNGAVVYAATDAGVFRSLDRGQTWLAPAPDAVVGSARVLAVPPAPAGAVYTGSRQGIFQSQNGGRSWRSASRGFDLLPAYRLWIAPSDPSVLYAFLGSTIMTSLDGGASWQERGPTIQGQVVTLAVHPRDPRTAFAGGLEGGLWKTTDAGGHWRRISPENACLSTSSLAIDPQAPDTVYAGGFTTRCPPALAHCKGLKSTDGGESWTCLGGPAEGFEDLALAPSRPEVLYGGTFSPALQPVVKSADGGRTWRPRSGGLREILVRSLVVSPEDERLVFAQAVDGLYKSVNGAATWTRIDPWPSARTLDLAFAPSDPSQLYAVVFAGSESAVYHSADTGESWAPVPMEGLLYGLTLIQVSPADPRTVYGVDEGIYRLRW